MLSSPRSPDAATPGTGNTPGVIGAQEVSFCHNCKIRIDMQFFTRCRICSISKFQLIFRCTEIQE